MSFFILFLSAELELLRDDDEEEEDKTNLFYEKL